MNEPWEAGLEVHLFSALRPTGIFPMYLSIHFPFPCVLAMPASTESGKAGIAFIICPLKDGRTRPFLFLLSLVLLML